MMFYVVVWHFFKRTKFLEKQKPHGCSHSKVSIKPCTYDTVEDMHLCFSSKVLGGINSYTAKQCSLNDMCDISNNKLATDQYSSYKVTNQSLRSNVEKYFIENYKLQLITKN